MEALELHPIAEGAFFDNDPKHMKQIDWIETTSSFLIMDQSARCNFHILPKSKAYKSIDAYKEIFKK